MKVKKHLYKWDDRLYYKRVKRHKRYEKFISWIVRFVALRLVKLGGYELEITHKKEGYDHYQSCKHWEKEFCTRKKTWQGYLKNGGYRVLGSSENEIYCELIKMLLFRPIRFPFCYK